MLSFLVFWLCFIKKTFTRFNYLFENDFEYLNNLSDIPFCTVMFGVNSVLGIFEKLILNPVFFVVDICKDVLGNVRPMNNYSILLSTLCRNLMLYQTGINWYMEWIIGF